jgi:nodulation protein E
MRRVAITGIGVISALGYGREEFWRSLSAGRSGIRPISLSKTLPLAFQNGAEISDFDPASSFPRSESLALDRFAQFAVLAAREAIQDSGIVFDDRMRDRSAVVTGSCLGGQVSEDTHYFELYAKGRTHFPPASIPRIMANAGACHISVEFALRGPSFTISTACSSSSHAIGQAFWLIRHGAADIAVTGGSEAPFAYGHLKAWEALRIIAPDTCRPFSKQRRGTILGEGASMLVLEDLEKAQERRASIYAELVGFGMTSDAHHLTQPAVDGAARAMTLAMEDGSLNAGEIDYLNAHGTGTQMNDVTEAQAIRRAFGCCADHVAVSSTKSMHGHALGAAGALEAAATVLAMQRSEIPPTINFVESDPECDLDLVVNESRPGPIRAALSNSFSFGGMNAVLAFRSVL